MIDASKETYLQNLIESLEAYKTQLMDYSSSRDELPIAYKELITRKVSDLDELCGQYKTKQKLDGFAYTQAIESCHAISAELTAKMSPFDPFFEPVFKEISSEVDEEIKTRPRSSSIRTSRNIAKVQQAKTEAPPAPTSTEEDVIIDYKPKILNRIKRYQELLSTIPQSSKSSTDLAAKIEEKMQMLQQLEKYFSTRKEHLDCNGYEFSLNRLEQELQDVLTDSTQAKPAAAKPIDIKIESVSMSQPQTKWNWDTSFSANTDWFRQATGFYRTKALSFTAREAHPVVVTPAKPEAAPVKANIAASPAPETEAGTPRMRPRSRSVQSSDLLLVDTILHEAKSAGSPATKDKHLGHSRNRHAPIASKIDLTGGPGSS